jgi:hypothetical protein
VALYQKNTLRGRSSARYWTASIPIRKLTHVFTRRRFCASRLIDDL